MARRANIPLASTGKMPVGHTAKMAVLQMQPRR